MTDHAINVIRPWSYHHVVGGQLARRSWLRDLRIGEGLDDKVGGLGSTAVVVSVGRKDLEDTVADDIALVADDEGLFGREVGDSAAVGSFARVAGAISIPSPEMRPSIEPWLIIGLEIFVSDLPGITKGDGSINLVEDVGG